MSAPTLVKTAHTSTYRVTLDGVTFTAERVHALHKDFSVSVHVGACDLSYRLLEVRLRGGYGIGQRFAALAAELRADESRFVSRFHTERGTISEGLCQDRPACDRFRPTLYVSLRDAA